MKVNLTAAFAETAQAPERGQIDYWDEHLPGFALRVSDRRKKMWTLMYRCNRRLRRLTLGTYPTLSLADARRGARDALRKVQLGDDPAQVKRDTADQAEREHDERVYRSFAALAERFLEKHAKVRNRCWRQAERTIKRELLPRWGHLPACDVKRRDVIELVEEIAERGAGVMANRVKAQVSKLFNFGLQEKDPVVEANPARDVRNPTPERRRDRVLSEAEILALWRALDGEPARVAGIFKLALLTAQRKSEVMRLRWGEFDLDAGWWTIPAARAKNKQSHRVPLGPQALALLREFRSAGAGPAYVFAGARGGPVANLSATMRGLRKRASLADFRFHDLRRTAATHLTGTGVPRLVVAKILNHADREVTAIYDRHSYDRDKRAALEGWDRRLAVIVKPGAPPSEKVEERTGMNKVPTQSALVAAIS